MSKSIAVAFAVLIAPGAWLGAQPAPASVATASVYAPGTHRYRVTREMKSTQDMQGDVQSNAISTTELLTLELRAAGRDSMRFSFTIDSATRESDMPGSEVAPAKGRKASGAVSPRGIVRHFDADTAAGPDISAALRNFLPYLPAGGLKAGMMWADTVHTPFSQNGIDGNTITIVTSRVLGDTTIAGQKAWRIDRKGTLSMSGTGNQGGADLILSGAGTATGISHIGTNGVYLGASSTQELDITVQVPMASMTIPIKQTTLTTIELLPGGPPRS